MKAPYKKFFLAGLVSFAFIAACSSNSTPKSGDDDDGAIVGGSTGTGGKTDGTGSTGSGGKDGSGGGSGGGIVVPPTGREDCPDEPNNSEDECWDLTKCNGTSELQFLKQCNDGECFPFNNSAKIPGYTGDDSLPALP